MTTSTIKASIAKHNWTTVKALIDELAEKLPNRVYLVDPENNVEITFLELRDQARKIAHFIQQQNIEQGESVAYAMSNDIHTGATVLGIIYGGFVATAINLVSGNDTISYVLEHSEAKLVITNSKGAEVISTVVEHSSVGLPIADVATVLSQAATAEFKDHEIQSTDALLMYTSGTTGRPKGVILTQKNLIAGGRNTVVAHQLSSQDRGLCVLPLYHINGLCVTLMGALVSFGSLIIPKQFSVSNFWETIVKYKATWFSVVPTQISYLLHSESNLQRSEQLTHLRFGRSASAPLSPEVQQAFENKFSIPIIETMGLTETAAQILSNPLPPGVRKIGSPGVSFGNEVKIVNTALQEVPAGTEGELLVRGSNVMRCYLKNEQATNEALTPDGWLRTGDLGKIDEDKYVYITGRLKELIIKGGENIAPREIDEALYCHSDVIEAAAFAKKCDNYGERVEAAVMVKENSTLTEESLKALCIEKIGAFKSPDRIYFLPELPKGPSGKIQRMRLSAMTD